MRYNAAMNTYIKSDGVISIEFLSQGNDPDASGYDNWYRIDEETVVEITSTPSDAKDLADSSATAAAFETAMGE